jgi:hypothetical protein
MLTFLKSERAIDYLRWIVAFVAVVSTYGVAAWLVLRPTGWQLDVNAPVVEINLRDLPQPPAAPPSDRASEPATSTKPPGDNGELAGAADPTARIGDGSAGRGDGGDAAKDADAVDTKDGSTDAAKTAALDPATAQPGASSDATPEAPPKTEAPAADSGAGGRATAALPRLAAPDTGAGTAGAPIDTSITVNQGRSLLRTAKAGPQSKGLPLPQLPQLKLTLPVATPNRNQLLTRRPSSIVGLALPAPGLTLPAPVLPAPAASQGRAQDLTQKPAMSADGGLTRNAIGVVIEQRAVVPHAGPALGLHLHAGAPLGTHPLAGATAMHASGEHGPTATVAAVPFAAGHASPTGTSSAGTANQSQAGHPDRALQANHIAAIGGPAINGAGLSRPASSTGALGGPAHAVAGALNGSSFRSKYR